MPHRDCPWLFPPTKGLIVCTLQQHLIVGCLESVDSDSLCMSSGVLFGRSELVQAVRTCLAVMLLKSAHGSRDHAKQACFVLDSPKAPVAS